MTVRKKCPKGQNGEFRKRRNGNGTSSRRDHQWYGRRTAGVATPVHVHVGRKCRSHGYTCTKNGVYTRWKCSHTRLACTTTAGSRGVTAGSRHCQSFCCCKTKRTWKYLNIEHRGLNCECAFNYVQFVSSYVSSLMFDPSRPSTTNSPSGTCMIRMCGYAYCRS